MKTQIYSSRGIAASAAAVAMQKNPKATIKIEPVAIGFVLLIQRPKPMRARPIWIKLAAKACTQVQPENR